MNKCIKTIPVGGSCDHVSAECGFGTRCYSGICTAYGSLLIGTYLNLTFDDEAQANANLTQNPYPLSTMYLCQSFHAVKLPDDIQKQVNANFVCAWGPELIGEKNIRYSLSDPCLYNLTITSQFYNKST